MHLMRWLIPLLAAASAPAAEPAGIDQPLAGLRAAVDRAQTSSHDQAAWQAYVRVDHQNVPAMLDLIEAHPSYDALDTALWLASENHLFCGAPELPVQVDAQRRAMALLNRYTAREGIGKVTRTVVLYWWVPASDKEAWLESIRKTNSVARDYAQATLMLAQMDAKRAASAATPGTNERPPVRTDTQRILYALYDGDQQEMMARGGPGAFEQRAIDLYQEVIDKFGDEPAPLGRRATCGALAAAELKALRTLKVGKMAPEIVGQDLNDQPVKLSDFRGKTVILSFWGSWCGPCMALVPLENELAARHARDGVQLLGVNSDSRRSVGLAAARKEGMTWPSFWNGERGPMGPIAREWDVQIWPTLFVIDPAGKIVRHVSGSGKGTVDELERAIAAAQRP